jgi:hypothetical protein
MTTIFAICIGGEGGGGGGKTGGWVISIYTYLYICNCGGEREERARERIYFCRNE